MAFLAVIFLMSFAAFSLICTMILSLILSLVRWSLLNYDHNSPILLPKARRSSCIGDDIADEAQK